MARVLLLIGARIRLEEVTQHLVYAVADGADGKLGEAVGVGKDVVIHESAAGRFAFMLNGIEQRRLLVGIYKPHLKQSGVLFLCAKERVVLAVAGRGLNHDKGDKVCANCLADLVKHWLALVVFVGQVKLGLRQGLGDGSIVGDFEAMPGELEFQFLLRFEHLPILSMSKQKHQRSFRISSSGRFCGAGAMLAVTQTSTARTAAGILSVAFPREGVPAQWN